MKLFLLRHGMTSRASTDEERSLTTDGINDLKDVVNRRKDEMQGITQVHVGPLWRVRQTGIVACNTFGYKGEIVDNPSLMKLTRGQEVMESLNHIKLIEGDMLMVSHESSLCNLLMWLANEDVLMSNSSLCMVETDEFAQGAGTLIWQESPNSSAIKRTSTWVDMI